MLLTQSVWLLASLVNLQSAIVFHNLIPLSAPAEIIYLLSGEKATVNTSFVCPTKWRVALHVLKSHNLKVLSQELEIINKLSWDNATSLTKWLWPCNDLWGIPHYLVSSSSSLYKFQTIKFLSLDPEIKMLGSSFSF